MAFIRIRGARTHNLKNVDLDLPRGRLIVVTGVSGSGKSSLAFDTLYAEGQRRYVESLSAQARKFLDQLPRPEVDAIEGLSPAIAIEQKTLSPSPRSTVGTLTEIHDYLRVLFARLGTPYCPEHPEEALTHRSMSDFIESLLHTLPQRRIALLSPLVLDTEPRAALASLKAQGFTRIETGGEFVELDGLQDAPSDAPRLVIDRLRVREEARARLADSLELALKMGHGRCFVRDLDEGEELTFVVTPSCPRCGFTAPALEPQLFSFNHPAGACPTCEGTGRRWELDAERLPASERSLREGALPGLDLGNAFSARLLEDLAAYYGFSLDTPWSGLPEPVRRVLLFGSGEEPIPFRYPLDRSRMVLKSHPFEGWVSYLQRRHHPEEERGRREKALDLPWQERPCPTCGGSRLQPFARAVRVAGMSLPELTALPLSDCASAIERIATVCGTHPVAEMTIGAIRSRLRFLLQVGLSYLSLDRASHTLSGGEAQRIRLASQVGSGLTGVLYVLDEPSIGLHPRNQDDLLRTLEEMRDLGNTVVVVEHDEATIRRADHVVEVGPGAGREGGEILVSGSLSALLASPRSRTAPYLQRPLHVPHRSLPCEEDRPTLRLQGCHAHNLQGIDVEIPLGCLVVVTGVSGSGKSSLVEDTLVPILRDHLSGRPCRAPCTGASGLEAIDKLIVVDQSPIGRTPRSNPATYTGIMDGLRELFAATPEARMRGYRAARFSFNLRGGRCEVCEGEGYRRIDLQFLPDVYLPCEACSGKRYNRETLEIRYRGLNIHESLSLTVEEALHPFGSHPTLRRKLEILQSLGLGYLPLNQPATTLSGGEAQRLKLAAELMRRDTGRTLYVLDEPTTGLHWVDVEQLLTALFALRDRGNTLVVIEHHLDVIAHADWVIDLGPGAGEAGGRIVACGTPAAIAAHPDSVTGRYLAERIGSAR